ncbi:MAG: flavin reductase family protein [Pseudomonadota bacterium]
MTSEHDIQRIPLPWAYRLLNHGPLVLVSTTDGERGDVSTVAWARPCQKNPPRFSLTIGTSHRTWKNLTRTGILCINVPTADLVDLVLYCGRCSGDDVDKIQLREIPIRAGGELRTLPLVDSCAAWLECRVTAETLAEGTSRIEVEAVAASCRAGVLSPQFTWNVDAWPTLHHLGGSRFLVGDQMLNAE